MNRIEGGGLGNTSSNQTADAQNRAEWVAENMPVSRAGALDAHPSAEAVGNAALHSVRSTQSISQSRVQNSLGLAKQGVFDWHKDQLDRFTAGADGNKVSNFTSTMSDLLDPLKSHVAQSSKASASTRGDFADAVDRWGSIAASYSASASSTKGVLADLANSEGALKGAYDVSSQTSAINQSLRERLGQGDAKSPNGVSASASVASDSSSKKSMEWVQSKLSDDLQQAGMNKALADRLATSLVSSAHMAAAMSVADPTPGAEGAQLRTSLDNVEGIVKAALGKLPPSSRESGDRVFSELSTALGTLHDQVKSTVKNVIEHQAAMGEFQRKVQMESGSNPLQETSADQASEDRDDQREDDRVQRMHNSILTDN